ncbi:MAG: hypothetical protein R3Y57_01575 [Erysipelotrichaceae bacterium]
MKSKVLKIRNIPQELVLDSLYTKPTLQLAFIFIAGIVLLVMDERTQVLGILCIIFACYGIFVAPNRLLIQFFSEYLVLYNCLTYDECHLVYWDEVLSWAYIRRPKYDCLSLELIDGRVEEIDCFNRLKIENYLNIYAKDKKRKPVKGKRIN